MLNTNASAGAKPRAGAGAKEQLVCGVLIDHDDFHRPLPVENNEWTSRRPRGQRRHLLDRLAVPNITAPWKSGPLPATTDHQPQTSSSIGRAAVSKTVCRGFESLLVCQI